MGDRFKAWLEDPDIRPTLEGQGAGVLNEVQQTALEDLVDRRARGEDALGSKEYATSLRKLVPPLRNKREAGFLVGSLSAILDSRKWQSTGRDPHLYEAGTVSRRGTSPNR